MARRNPRSISLSDQPEFQAQDLLQTLNELRQLYGGDPYSMTQVKGFVGTNGGAPARVRFLTDWIEIYSVWATRFSNELGITLQEADDIFIHGEYGVGTDSYRMWASEFLANPAKFIEDDALLARVIQYTTSDDENGSNAQPTPWYSTQGGGRAAYNNLANPDMLFFIEAPKWDPNLMGQEVPKDWDVQGPFYNCPRPHHLLLAGETCPTCGETIPTTVVVGDSPSPPTVAISFDSPNTQQFLDNLYPEKDQNE